MIAEKQAWQNINIDIIGITLLSEEEYERYKNIIPPIIDSWWLRSPGANQYDAAYVYPDGSVSHYYVHYDYIIVRPVIILSNEIAPGTIIRLRGYTWTVLPDSMAICNEAVGQTCFRNDSKAPDANVYEKSDIKVWLENWAKERGLISERGMVFLAAVLDTYRELYDKFNNNGSAIGILNQIYNKLQNLPQYDTLPPQEL